MLMVESVVAKTGKYAVPESGDSAEVVERPRGGVSLVVVDGQRSGRAAKAVSHLVIRKAASLILEGVRDGAAARAASDYLLVSRRGQVSADLTVLSTDLETRSVVITRNTLCPVLVLTGGESRSIDAPSCPLGTSRMVRPQMTELPIEADLVIVAFTDGVWEAGTLSTHPQTVPEWLLEQAIRHRTEPKAMADSILAAAVALDQGRPRDDMTVAVMAIRDSSEALNVRRLHVLFPLP